MKGSRNRGESLSQMNKRVDFSLGASSSASGDYAGDVYEDRARMRIPIEVQEASAERERSAQRHSQERGQVRESSDFGRSTSREERFAPGNLARRSTDSGSRWRNGNSVHRNRFFGRGGNFRPGTGEEQLLESGQMEDIPENPSAAGSGLQSQAPSNERLDARTGMVSPAAWRMNTNEGNLRPEEARGGVTFAGGALQDGTNAPAGHRPMGRSQTEDFEMRRFR